MSVRIATSRTISGDTFYKNQGFDICFSAVTPAIGDVCLSFSNSTYGVLPYVNSNTYRFSAPSNTITTTGNLGTLSVDMIALNPVTVTSVTDASYVGMIGVTTDPSGNVFFTVANQHRVFQLDTSGVVSVFAGTGTAGDTEGPRLSAQFREPAGITTDGSGTFYLCDKFRVRKIAPNGTVSTIAGSSTSGYVDSSGANARFNGPGSVVIRPTGGLLVSDADVHRIRGVTFDGIVTTYAGTGVPGYLDSSLGGAQFFFPYGMAYDSAGTLYIADNYNHRIRGVSNGATTTFTYAGNGIDGTSSGPRLSSALGRPGGLAYDSGANVLYICSQDRCDIRKLTPTTLSTVAGTFALRSFANGYAPNALFNGPTLLTVRGSNLYVTDLFNGVLRNITTFPDVRPDVDRTPSTAVIVATSNYPIVINSRIDVCWTSVGGRLPLFKFEPFDASFTANQCGGTTTDTLTYSTTSTELIGYMSGTGTSNVLFRGSNGPSVAYTYPLTLSVRAISNLEVVDDVSTSVTIGTARIIYSPCNANLVFYRNEPSPAPVFSLVSSDASLMYSGTTLPAGLSFTRAGARSFALTGTPTIQTIASNYTILGFDTRNRTYATQVSMVVNPERLILDVSGSLTQSNVLDTAPIEPITFTARFPPYTAYRAMRYSWTPPPPIGLEFRDISGVAIPGSTYSVDTTRDASFTMTLSGTISPSYLRTLAESNISNYSITVTGTRTSPLPSLSPSLPRTITLRFGETIFFPSKPFSNVPSLFVGLPVSNDFFYTAKTYFATTDTSITDIAVTDGFLPDGLDGSFTPIKQQFALSGTPTNAATYPFTLTATNGNGITASLSVAPTVFNDSITITPLDGTSFNFIQSRNLSNSNAGYPYPIRFSVASASDCNVTLTATNLPAGVTITSGTEGSYDVSLNGRPTTAAGVTTATLTANVPATGVSATTTFTYSVSAETFFFPSPTFAFAQNVPITPVQIDVSTLSENPVIRFSSPNIPAALQITNTGLISGTLQGDTSGTFDVTAFTAYTSGTRTYSYTTTPDKVLLQPSVYTTVTAPGCNVSIPINGYSLSALTVSNFRFQDPFPYGLTVNPTTGLLSGTLASSLPNVVDFTVLGNAGTVVGSLSGSIQTQNLATEAPNLITILNQSNLRLYSGDATGTAWQLMTFNDNTVAARIGINGTGTYIVPTSSDTLLRSTTGTSYTSVALGQSSFSPLMTGIVYDAVSSTWWIGGTLSNGSRSVRVFKSLNDGVTWDSGTTVAGVQDRSGNADPGAGVYDAYLYGGVDLAYRSGILLLGGKQIARSTDGGATWSTRSSSLIEVARFSLDQGTVWLAVGSSLYSSTTNNTYTAAATTIVYSLDQGLTWTNASGGFNMNAYEIVYGDGVWLATGLDWTGSAFVGRIRYSFDGLTWAVLTSIPDYPYGSTPDVRPPGIYGAITYIDSTWRVIAPTASFPNANLYTHPGDTPIDSGWTSTTALAPPSDWSQSPRYQSYVTQTIDPGADTSIIQFPTGASRPTFTSPRQSTYVVWQYMPIPTITFAATSIYPVSYFVSSLPVGLTWNSTTYSISGACMQTGTQTFTVYAVADIPGDDGVTPLTITLICDVPRIIKKQTGAGAYTALVRDYTEVAAAINARDTRVNPTEEAALGSFASPYAPDVVTPSNCPC